MRAQSNDSLCVTGRSNELDLNRVWRINLHDRADVSTLEPVARQIGRNYYSVESPIGHVFTPLDTQSQSEVLSRQQV